jgi:hypothetical protein
VFAASSTCCGYALLLGAVLCTFVYMNLLVGSQQKMQIGSSYCTALNIGCMLCCCATHSISTAPTTKGSTAVFRAAHLCIGNAGYALELPRIARVCGSMSRLCAALVHPVVLGIGSSVDADGDPDSVLQCCLVPMCSWHACLGRIKRSPLGLVASVAGGYARYGLL